MIEMRWVRYPGEKPVLQYRYQMNRTDYSMTGPGGDYYVKPVFSEWKNVPEVSSYSLEKNNVIAGNSPKIG